MKYSRRDVYFLSFPDHRKRRDGCFLSLPDHRKRWDGCFLSLPDHRKRRDGCFLSLPDHRKRRDGCFLSLPDHRKRRDGRFLSLPDPANRKSLCLPLYPSTPLPLYPFSMVSHFLDHFRRFLKMFLCLGFLSFVPAQASGFQVIVAQVEAHGTEFRDLPGFG